MAKFQKVFAGRTKCSRGPHAAEQGRSLPTPGLDCRYKRKNYVWVTNNVCRHTLIDVVGNAIITLMYANDRYTEGATQKSDLV